MTRFFAFAFATFFFSFAAPSVAVEQVLRFEQYPVAVKQVRKAPLHIARGTFFWDFRTRTKAAWAGEANFAGHYRIEDFGCGTECQDALMVDHENGRAYRVPTASYGHFFDRTSNLLIVNPPPKADEDVTYWVDKETRYFVWDGSDFVLIHEQPWDGESEGE